MCEWHCLDLIQNFVNWSYAVYVTLDFRFLPRKKWHLRSSGMLCIIYQHSIKSQKIASLNFSMSLYFRIWRKSLTFECKMHVDFSLTATKPLSVTYKKVAYNKPTDAKNYKYGKVSHLCFICDIFHVIWIGTVGHYAYKCASMIYNFNLYVLLASRHRLIYWRKEKLSFYTIENTTALR